MRATIYARVSTPEQKSGMQLAECRQFCRRRRWRVVREWVDQASGARDSRVSLDAMMAEVRRGRYDVVVVYRFDRFARSLRHLVLALAEFQASGVAFVSIHDAVDTSTPAGRMGFHILGAVAEFELELARERVRSGIADARRRGVRIGRQPVISRGLASTVAIRRAGGASWREIARDLKISVKTARRSQNQAYTAALFEGQKPSGKRAA